jgi:hypothetical protein
MVLHRFAPMGITTITRMRARLTASTAQIGSLAVCSLGRDLGFTGFTAAVPIGVVDGIVDASDAGSTGADVDSRDEAVLIADADLRDEAVLDVAVPLGTDRLAVDSAAMAVVSTVEGAAPSMVVEAGSTAEAAVASTVAAMAAAIGN